MIISVNKEEVIRQFDFKDLYRYLQVEDRSRLPNDLSSQIDNSRDIFAEDIEPYAIYREFEEFEKESEGIIVEGVKILSNVLAKISLDAKSIFVFIVTNGDKIERRSTEYYNKGFYFMSQLSDACGSVFVEALLRSLLNRLEIENKDNGYLLSAPYSPGYCDINISQQKSIFELLKQENNRVILNSALQMQPEKSISGVFFKMPREIAKRYKQYYIFCKDCNNRLCKYYKK